MDRIRGRTIAITGAARGIGHAIATALPARGARVVLGDRDISSTSPSRPLLPEMVARRSGHLVNVASIAGMVAAPGQIVYAGTKSEDH